MTHAYSAATVEPTHPAPSATHSPHQDADLGHPGRAVEAVRPAGHTLDSGVRSSMESRFGYDFAAVRVHDDAAAHDAAHDLGASAYAVGTDIAFAPQAYDPQSSRGHALLSHELAHVVQYGLGLVPASRIQRQPAPPPASFIDELPESERKRILARGDVSYTSPDLQGLFAAGVTMGTALPKSTSIDLRGVDSKLTSGLTNVATDLVNVGNLPANSTLVLKISVTQGSGTFRFTHSKQLKAKTAQVVVENVGKPAPAAAAAPATAGTTSAKAPAQPDTKAPAGAGQKQPDPAAPDPYDEKVKKGAFTVKDFAGTDLGALKSALAKIPDAHLSKVSGLTIRRVATPAADVQASESEKTKTKLTGLYREGPHSVTIYDAAFSDTGSMFGDDKSGDTISAPARWIAHEIGHAIDFAPKRAAAKELAAKKEETVSAKAAVAEAAKELKAAGKASTKATPNPVYDAAKAGVASAKKELSAAQSAESDAATAATSAKKLSGEDKGYQAAAAKDGHGLAKSGVSAYARTDWGEHFAEAYSYYISSPALLKQIRPSTFDYFTNNFPK